MHNPKELSKGWKIYNKIGANLVLIARYSFFLSLILFLVSGSIASIILVTQVFPESINLIGPIIKISGKLLQIFLVSIVLFILLIITGTIILFIKKRKKKK